MKFLHILLALASLACFHSQTFGLEAEDNRSSAGPTTIESIQGDEEPEVNLCEGLLTDKHPHPMTPLEKPALGDVVVDPQFGTNIRRITAVADGEALRTMYSTTSAWNADESLLILYHVGIAHRLYDGKTYDFIKTLDIYPPDVEQIYWDTSDPDQLYYVDYRTLVRRNVRTGKEEKLRTFDFCEDEVWADSHAWMSWDTNLLSFGCNYSNGEFKTHFNYQIKTDTVLGPFRFDDRGLAFASASGNYTYWEGDVTDLKLNVIRELDLGNPWEHAALGQYANGHDTFNSVVFDPGPGGSPVGTLVVFDMTDGTWKVIIGPSTGYPYPPGGTHVSTLAYKRPGWVYVSIIADRAGQNVLDNEIVLANTNTGEVCRLAHHRSYGKQNAHLYQPYWAEPHVTASPSGTRALFASDWGNGPSVDSYVIELPAYSNVASTSQQD